jgi:hypothetical protein
VNRYIPKPFLVRAHYEGVRNTVDEVKFTIVTMVCSVLVMAWDYGRHQLIKGIRKG